MVDMGRDGGVYLEAGSKRIFAAAIEWPGWCRSARDEEAALAALGAYRERYAAVLTSAALEPADLPAERDLEVVERLQGGSGTDFGVPSVVPAADARPLTAAQADDLIRILLACWEVFDAAASEARGIELRKGPRGGGRELDAIVAHIDDADLAYLKQLGSRGPARGLGVEEQREEVRRRAVAGVRARALGEDLEDARDTRKPWPPRYYLRRAAWHALDHAWEIEDRSRPDEQC